MASSGRHRRWSNFSGTRSFNSLLFRNSSSEARSSPEDATDSLPHGKEAAEDQGNSHVEETGLAAVPAEARERMSSTLPGSRNACLTPESSARPSTVCSGPLQARMPETEMKEIGQANVSLRSRSRTLSGPMDMAWWGHDEASSLDDVGPSHRVKGARVGTSSNVPGRLPPGQASTAGEAMQAPKQGKDPTSVQEAGSGGGGASSSSLPSEGQVAWSGPQPSSIASFEAPKEPNEEEDESEKAGNEEKSRRPWGSAKLRRTWTVSSGRVASLEPPFSGHRVQPPPGEGKFLGRPDSPNILQRPYRDVSVRYELEKRIGSGTFGMVSRCVDRITGESLACKSIQKGQLACFRDLEAVRMEVQVLEAVGSHPAVVTLIGVYEDPKSLHLVMELCEGGDLFSRLNQRARYKEAEAAEVCLALVSALAFCHQRGMMHRDLKPENVLLASRGDHVNIRVADFGQAATIEPGVKLTEVLGTAMYIAPEVLNQSYGPEADLWSLGVILYILLVGSPPFWGDTKKEIYERTCSGKVDLESGRWKKVSAAAKDLVRRLLTLDPNERIAAEDVKNHPWILHHSKKSSLPLFREPLFAPPPPSSSAASPRGELSSGCTSPTPSTASSSTSPAVTRSTSLSSKHRYRASASHCQVAIPSSPGSEDPPVHLARSDSETSSFSAAQGSAFCGLGNMLPMARGSPKSFQESPSSSSQPSSRISSGRPPRRWSRATSAAELDLRGPIPHCQVAPDDPTPTGRAPSQHIPESTGTPWEAESVPERRFVGYGRGGFGGPNMSGGSGEGASARAVPTTGMSGTGVSEAGASGTGILGTDVTGGGRPARAEASACTRPAREDSGGNAPSPSGGSLETKLELPSWWGGLAAARGAWGAARDTGDAIGGPDARDTVHVAGSSGFRSGPISPTVLTPSSNRPSCSGPLPSTTATCHDPALSPAPTSGQVPPRPLQRAHSAFSLALVEPPSPRTPGLSTPQSPLSCSEQGRTGEGGFRPPRGRSGPMPAIETRDKASPRPPLYGSGEMFPVRPRIRSGSQSPGSDVSSLGEFSESHSRSSQGRRSSKTSRSNAGVIIAQDIRRAAHSSSTLQIQRRLQLAS